ncbi:MAG: cobalamin 5-phosphate synthase [Proteobacteria bacterium]|nr:cobalamin 5-phosphate synthase [Pseudomonadota bacterium]
MTARSELHSLLGAIGFFTRLPVPGQHGAVALERAIRYFPAVGLLVGAIAALVFVAASLVWPKTLALVAAIAVAIAVTGAIHEDGWSDMVDGFGGGANRDKVLAIMRDSALGSFGALALAMLIIARFFALLEIDAALLPIALIAGHAVSRLCATFVLGALDYARSEGKAKPFANRLGHGELVFATLCALAPLALLPPWPALAGLLLALIATRWLARLFKQRIGGYTGDCLGATQQLAELAFYGGLLCRFS